MLSIEKLKKEFIKIGHSERSAQIHAECKRKADIYFDVSIKNKRRFISPVLHNIEQHTPVNIKKIKSFYKKGGKILYLKPKGTRKVYVKVAIPATTQTGLKPYHKMTPEQSFALDAVKIFGRY